jgi:TPR repeat protein
MSYALLYKRDASPQYPQEIAVPADNSLFDALQTNDIAAFQRSIKDGADVNFCDERGVTPLHSAAYHGLLGQVRLLLKSGADVNARTKVRFFEDGTKRRSGETPIEWAAERVNNTVIIDLLVPVTNDTYVRRVKHWAKWHLAMVRGDVLKAIVLLEKLRDLNRCDNSYHRPLEVAAAYGQLPLVEYLLGRGAKTSYGKNKETPLHVAAEHGHYEVSKLLIEHGSPISLSPYHEEATPLFNAVSNGHQRVAKLLLRYGASVWESHYGDSLLGVAAAHDDVPMIRLLFRYDADPNTIGSYYENPLFPAARSGAIRAMKVLIKAGADVNWQDEGGFKPIYDAAKEGRADAVKLLLKNGASLEKCARKKGDSPLLEVCHEPKKDDWIERWESGDGLQPPPPEYYEKKTPPRSDRKYYARFVETVKILLQNGADPNVRYTDSHSTPLHGAALTGDAEIAMLLIEAGADENALDKNGSSPLAVAKSLGNEDVAKVLLGHGAKEINKKPRKRRAKSEESKRAVKDESQPEEIIDIDEIFLRDAEKGDVCAMSMVANHYLYEGNFAAAMRWFSQAVSAGNDTSAMQSIGRMYAQGKGVPKDYQQANKWFLKAAENGDKFALLNLAAMYRDGDGVPRNGEQALHWFTMAAERGNPEAMVEIATMYYDGIGVSQDYSLAMEWGLKAAKAGEITGMHNVGTLYRYGEGVSVDYSKALQWFRKAAKAGFAPSMNSLGTIYTEGKGVTVNYQKAMEWFRKGAKKGDEIASLNVGLMYEFGDGLPRDYRKALDWYHKAACHGSTQAMVSIAQLYYKGKGVPKCKAQAVNWYQKAAEGGNKEAWHCLGLAYYFGDGISPDYEQGMRWLLKAAKAGDADAMHNVAMLYEEGDGIPQDYQRAMHWYQKAAKCGNPGSQASVDALRKIMDANQLGIGK